MNTMYKVLIWAALGVAIVGVFFPHRASQILGGQTNYDQLTLDVPQGGNALTVSSTAAINAGAQWVGKDWQSTVSSTFLGRVSGGAVLSIVPTGGAGTTYNAVASNVCNNSVWNVNPLATGTINLPTAAALIADCFTADGVTKTLVVRNIGGATTTVLVASTGVLTTASPSTTALTIFDGDGALVTFTRVSSTAVMAAFTAYGAF
jgi:hypothetical protein